MASKISAAISTLIIFLCLVTIAPVAHSTPAPRFALIVANGDYTSLNRLSNPVRDGQALARELRLQNFDVTFLPNVTKTILKAAAQAHRQKVLEHPGAVSLVYYTGHGLQIDGQNSLLMVDANLNMAGKGRYAIAEFLFDAAPAGLAKTIFIFDACRTIATSSQPLSAGFGEAGMREAPPGSFIAYSTSAGRPAVDGAPSLGSPYLRALLEQIPVPGQRIEVMFSEIGARVLKLTEQLQYPSVYGQWSDSIILSVEEASTDAKLVAAAKAKYYGTGETRDLRGAYNLALQAAKNGYKPGMNQVASQLYWGDGTKKDVAAALKWWNRAADLGDQNALLSLAAVSPDGKYLQRALPLFQRLVAEGDTWAMYNLAFHYEKGIRLPANYGEARRLYKLAADGGVSSAMVNLGTMFESGIGGPVDPVGARDWYRRAADGGSLRGATNLGRLLSTAGTGSRDPIRDREAVQWLRKAVEVDPEAAPLLGWHYYFGIGVEERRSEAVKIWTAGSRSGSISDRTKANLKLMINHAQRGRWRECGHSKGPGFCRS